MNKLIIFVVLMSGLVMGNGNGTGQANQNGADQITTNDMLLASSDTTTVESEEVPEESTPATPTETSYEPSDEE